MAGTGRVRARAAPRAGHPCALEVEGQRDHAARTRVDHGLQQAPLRTTTARRRSRAGAQVRAARRRPDEPAVPRLPRVLLERAAARVLARRRRDRDGTTVGCARCLPGLLARSLLRRQGLVAAVNVETGSFWRLLMPAFPAYFLLLVSIPLLVPVWRTAARALPDRAPAARMAAPKSARACRRRVRAAAPGSRRPAGRRRRPAPRRYRSEASISLSTRASAQP